ncbi:MAG: hypothetical protein EOP92_12420 [Lysobacteraceae bacterium]|nr:MAG: hypothetical protein EOP92_12420 [Xanthomonadaceae bacterium]
MNMMVSKKSRRGMRRSMLCAALLSSSCFVPAWAGVRCVMVDANNADYPYNDSDGVNSVACGYANNTDLTESGGNIRAGDESSAFGYRNLSPGRLSNAFGRFNRAEGVGSNAFGGAYDENIPSIGRILNTASGGYSNAFGVGNQAEAWYSTAVGFRNVAAGGSGSTAVGYSNDALGGYSTAMGYDNRATRLGSAAMGYFNAANGPSSIAMGSSNIAYGEYSSAIGFFARTGGARSVVVSGWYDRDGDGTFEFDMDTDGDGFLDTSSETSSASGTSAVALGTGVTAMGEASAALGVNATANADYSVAVGFGAVADREYTISVGSAAQMNQIVNLAPGTEDEDAVNLSQLYPLATALGGGASYAGGIFTAPTYIIQASNYTNIGSAFTAVDNALTDINQRIVNAGGVQGERGLSAYEVAVSNGFAGTENDWLQSLGGAQGPTGPTGPEGPAGGGPRSVTYDSDTLDVLTMAGADGTRIANVADGVEATDAVNLGQMEAGDADTLAAANEYTDNTATETLSAANTYTDQRFAEITGLADSFDTFRGEVDRRFTQQDRRIDKQGSMSSAMLNMAINAAGSQSPRGRIAAGVGFQGGERALSVGYAKRIGQRASFSLGGAFSGSEKSAGVGFGVDL